MQCYAQWRMAVWAIRAGYFGLAVAVCGLIAKSLGSTPWILAVGVIIWLSAAAVTLSGFFWCRNRLPEPRPTTSPATSGIGVIAPTMWTFAVVLAFLSLYFEWCAHRSGRLSILAPKLPAR